VSDERHKLLVRQLGRAAADLGDCPDWIGRLLDLVDDSYRAFDSDLALLERSVELSSQELFQANSEMRAILSVVPDLFLWLDRAGNILSVHAGKSNDLLLPAARLVGQKIFGLADAVAGGTLERAVVRVGESREAVLCEYPLVIDGTSQVYEARLLPLLEDQTLAIVRNVTERKEAEAALANQKERLAVTLRSIGDGVIATDTEGRITMMNRAAEELSGWGQSCAAGKPVAEVFSISAIATGERLDPVAEVLGGGTAWVIDGESLLETASGPPVRIAHSVAAIRDPKSEMIGVAVCFRDVGEKHRAEQDRLRASKLDSIGLLAGGIAHDFNNILMSLLAAASLAKLEAERDPTGVRDLLDEIEMATLRARDLTQQLLTFSRGGAPVKATGSIAELIRESAVFALRGSNVRCHFELAADLYAVDMDAGQMSQVLNNLIINADQAMPDGGVVRIEAHNCPDGRRAVCITIRDEGVGIPEEFLGKIFDPYFTTKQKGSGLGLATSYSIVKNHGGTLSADSVVGRGTTFRIGLAASAASELEADPEEPLHRGTGRVLLMDDEQSIQRIGARMLSHLGYEVQVAGDGVDALSKFEAAQSVGEPFDVVIMDLTIPGAMGGVDAIARLRDLDDQVRVIASSGYSNDPVMARHADYGFDAVLAKPYTIQQLSAAMVDAPPPRRRRRTSQMR
jgi:PAS domain S-box-containing protein